VTLSDQAPLCRWGAGESGAASAGHTLQQALVFRERTLVGKEVGG
jgi:hypothetical protein